MKLQDYAFRSIKHTAGGVLREEIERIRADVITRRRIIHAGEIEQGGFFEKLWLRQIPTPLNRGPEYLQQFAVA